VCLPVATACTSQHLVCVPDDTSTVLLRKLERRDFSLACAAAIAGVAVWLPSASVRAQHFSYPKRTALFGFAALILASQMLRSRRFQSRSSFPECLAALLVLIWIVSPVEPSTIERLATWSASVASCAILVQTMRQYRRDESSGHLVIGTCLVASVLLVTCALEASGAIPPISELGRRPGGVFGNRNTAARVACLLLPIAWMGMGAPAIGRRRLIAVLSVSVAGCVIVLSRARAAWICTAVIVAVVAGLSVLHERSTRSRFGVFLVALSAGGLLALFAPYRSPWTLREYASSAETLLEWRSGSGNGRTVQFLTTMRAAKQAAFLGTGVGTWPREYLSVASPGDPTVHEEALYRVDVAPHAELVAILGELGVPGLGTALLLLMLVQHSAWHRLRREDHLDRSEAIACSATSAGVAFFSALEPILASPPTLVAVAIALGLTLPRAAEAPHQSIGGFRYSVRQLALLCVALVLSLGLACAATGTAGIVVLSTATRLSHYELAAKLAPLSLEAQHSLAFIWVAAGRCDFARKSIAAATALAPSSAPVRRLAERCGN
jgi:O-Antigen ligase